MCAEFCIAHCTLAQKLVMICRVLRLRRNESLLFRVALGHLGKGWIVCGATSTDCILGLLNYFPTLLKHPVIFEPLGW